MLTPIRIIAGRRWTRYAVYAYLVLIPSISFLLISSITSHDTARLAQIILASLCTAVLAVDLALQKNTALKGSSSGNYAWHTVLCVCILASVAGSTHPAMAWREIAIIAGCLSIVEIVASATKKREEMSHVVILASLLHAIPILAVAVSVQVSGLPLHPEQLFVGFDNPRFLNHVQTVTLPLLALTVTSSHLSRGWRAAAFLSLFVGFFALFLTGGRATMLALLVGTFGACLLLGRRVLPLVYWSASGAFLGFLIWAAMATHLFVAEGSPANAVSSQSGDSGRYYLWNIAKEHMSVHRSLE